MKKLVLTGAAGRLGSHLREPLSRLADELVSSDLIEDIGKLYPGERYCKAELAQYSEVLGLLEGADMVVHFGAIPDEAAFDDILQSNIIGAYNIWEAAYQHKLRRVVYASSIHAVGMRKRTDVIDTTVPHRPDSYYGLSKCFAEDLASLYWDKRQLESVCLRILTCSRVTSSRTLGTWLSYDDLTRLVERAIDTPVSGFSLVYGVSDNDRAPVTNHKASHLGYRPKDNAEPFAENILAEEGTADAADLAQTSHGGPFASVEPGQSGRATMNIVDDVKKS